MSGKTTFLTALLMIAFLACTSKKEAEDATKKSPTPSEAAQPQPEVHGDEATGVGRSLPLA